jgi:phage tail-like protein
MDLAPPVASEREYLRGQLPAVFLAGVDPVAPRLLAALEEVLDPVLAVVDGLPAYLEPELAPPDALALLCAWLGVPAEEEWSERRRRDELSRAAPLGALRGTRAGLELALRTAFPSLPLRIADSGSVRWSTGAAAPAAAPEVTVYCDTPLEERESQALARLLDEHVPVGVRARLRARPRRHPGGQDE